MAIANIVTNKPATAENFYSPFTPAKAVDGVVSPASRWISSKVPTSLTVDLQANYYVTQWSLSFMGILSGWKDWSPQYNMSDFMLQGSLDGNNWFDMDSVTGNKDYQINRSFSPKYTRYLKVRVTKGLNCNNQVASIVDFQAFETPNAPYLSILAPSTGVLSPAFDSHTVSYTMNVDNGVSNIKFTPTAIQGNMAIKVNGTSVTSGQPSQQIDLSVGTNAVTIEISSADNTMKTTYTVNIVRAGIASYLRSLSLKDNLDIDVDLHPTFSSPTLNYTASVDASASSVNVCPTAIESSATIKVNDKIVSGGSWSTPIDLVTGSNTIKIQVSSAGGAQSEYTVIVTK